jgi:nicotinate-nucleotide pyrophosphorylase (carboxylating)
MTLAEFVQRAITEDQGDGDHTSLACIPIATRGKARLLVKEPGIIAGVEVAAEIFRQVDESLVMDVIKRDGEKIKPGDVVFTVAGSEHSILLTERLVLNCMQRMSGIATETRRYADAVAPYKTKVLDTRKTTPLMRDLEKWAVRIGGGHNHRMGLYDMILIKDNHVDYAGGINNALMNVKSYQEKKGTNLKVEIETRNLEEVKQALETGLCNRIMLDNFTPEMLAEAVKLIGGKFETEASGGITLETIADYAKTGVDYISCGALTHSVKSLDLSLKAVR